MKHLSHRAAADFLKATRACHAYGIASRTETLDRVLALRQMCMPTGKAALVAERLLRSEDWPIISDWSAEPEQQQPTHAASHLLPSRLQRQQTTEAADENFDDAPDWFYLASSVSGLAEWEFHPYDIDPYPSVPHGHKKTDQRWKLDAYQGWVYERTRPNHRVPRSRIVALWNDTKFRAFALIAIRYHIDHVPYRRAWPVPNPLHLPRRR